LVEKGEPLLARRREGKGDLCESTDGLLGRRNH